MDSGWIHPGFSLELLASGLFLHAIAKERNRYPMAVIFLDAGVGQDKPHLWAGIRTCLVGRADRNHLHALAVCGLFNWCSADSLEVVRARFVDRRHALTAGYVFARRSAANF